jgi:hypothetical protein
LFRDYSVRIWGAGLESMKTYHFDFVDPRTSHPVNLPPAWRIFKTHGTLSYLASDLDLLAPVGMEVVVDGSLSWLKTPSDSSRICNQNAQRFAWYLHRERKVFFELSASNSAIY